MDIVKQDDIVLQKKVEEKEEKKGKKDKKEKEEKKEKETADSVINNFVEIIIDNFKPITIKGEKEELYFYYDGYYHKDAQSDLKHIADKFFRKYNHEELITPSIHGVLLHKVKSHHMINMDDFTEPKDKINLKSGVFDVYTRTLEPHYIYNEDTGGYEPTDTYNYHFLYKLDIDYNPSANCPKIIKFITDIADGDMSRYWCFIEFFGFILVSDYLRIKKYMLVFGRGDNGKSILEELLVRFLTPRNTVGLSIQQICDKDFLASKLHGKKLNIRGEMSQLKIGSMDKLKSFTGGDAVTLDRKYKDPLYMRNTAKLLFHFNELPDIDIKKMDEQSWKRMLFIILTRRFLGNDEDKELISKLTTQEELEGFLNLCLDGLNRLTKNGKFDYDDDSTYENWLECMENELAEFVSTNLTIDPNSIDGIPAEELYQLFHNQNGHVKMTKTKFTQLITRYPGVEVKRRKKDGIEQTRCYIGIKYNN